LHAVSAAILQHHLARGWGPALTRQRRLKGHPTAYGDAVENPLKPARWCVSPFRRLKD